MLATDSASPNTESFANRPTQPQPEPHAEQRRAQNLGDGAGNGDLPYREKVFEREVQAHAEHQKNDAYLRELSGEILVGDIARRKRSDGDAGEEIADDGRKPQTMGHGRERPSERQGSDDGGDERRVMRHGRRQDLRGCCWLFHQDRRG